MKKYIVNELIDPDDLDKSMLSDMLAGRYNGKIAADANLSDRYNYIYDRWMKKYIKGLERYESNVCVEAIIYFCNLIEDERYYKIQMWYDISILRKEKLKKLNERN